MIRIDKVVTRAGDGGETSLGDGARVPKDALRVEAYGTVDEANACVGLLRLHTAADPEADAMLGRIQQDLFDVGADLCVPGEAGDRLRVTDASSARLEAEVAAMNAALSPLTSFILPGGSALAAHLHLCRTVARRAERRATELAQGGDVNPVAVRYLNRLSDWLFVAARVANADAGGDILWVPGASREDSPGL